MSFAVSDAEMVDDRLQAGDDGDKDHAVHQRVFNAELRTEGPKKK